MASALYLSNYLIKYSNGITAVSCKYFGFKIGRSVERPYEMQTQFIAGPGNYGAKDIHDFSTMKVL
jgi:hypothetical protein